MAPAWLVQRAGWQGPFLKSEAEVGGCCRNSRCCRHVLHPRLRRTLVLADRLCYLGLCNVVAVLSLQIVGGIWHRRRRRSVRVCCGILKCRTDPPRGGGWSRGIMLPCRAIPEHEQGPATCATSPCCCFRTRACACATLART